MNKRSELSARTQEVVSVYGMERQQSGQQDSALARRPGLLKAQDPRRSCFALRYILCVISAELARLALREAIIQRALAAVLTFPETRRYTAIYCFIYQEVQVPKIRVNLVFPMTYGGT